MFRVESTDLGKIRKALRTAGGPETFRQVARDLKAAVEPAKRSVQDAVRATPASGEKHTGLRAAIAKATVVEVRTGGRQAGVSVVIRSARMPAGQKGLARVVDKPGGWRHPVYGHLSTWAVNPGHPYFDAAIRPHIPRIQEAVFRSLDQALTRAGL